MFGSRAHLKLFGLLTQIAFVCVYTSNADNSQPWKGHGAAGTWSQVGRVHTSSHSRQKAPVLFIQHHF